jgi:hypothetical protein
MIDLDMNVQHRSFAKKGFFQTRFHLNMGGL